MNKDANAEGVPFAGLNEPDKQVVDLLVVGVLVVGVMLLVLRQHGYISAYVTRGRRLGMQQCEARAYA